MSKALIFIVQGFGILNVKVFLQPLPEIINAVMFSAILAFTLYLTNRQNFYLKY